MLIKENEKMELGIFSLPTLNLFPMKTAQQK